MVNKVILIGNVGVDPEVRYTGDASNGAKVATIRLATSERYKDRSGNLQEHTEWHTVVAWRNTADVVEKYVKKGTQIYIEGRLRTRSWEDQTGNVGRHQVRGKLNSGEGKAENSSKGSYKTGLTNSGNTLKKYVTTADHCDNGSFNNVLLTDNVSTDLLVYVFALFTEFLYIFFCYHLIKPHFSNHY